jgi:PAS domain S-box-containing protein
MDVMSNKYELRYKWLMFSLLFMSVVVGAGWFATGYLGDMARQEIVKENEATITLLSTRLTDELKNLAGGTKATSGSPSIPPALISGNDQDIARANSVLDRYNSAMRASVSYLMDSEGKTIASSNRNDPDSFVGKSYQFRPYFTQAISGNAGRYFALGVTSLKRGFYAGYPVRDDKGAIIGVVTMKKDLDEIEANLSGDSYFFFINPQGIIFLSSKKDMLFKSLWPISKEIGQALLASKQFGNKPFEAVLSQEIADGMDVTLSGKHFLVSRKVIDPEGWSIVFMHPTERIFLYRSIGVIVTLLICTFILIPLIVNYKTARSEEHYRTLFNENLDSICLADAKTRIIIDCNHALTALVCRKRAELIGRPQMILHPPQGDKEAFSHTFKQHLTDKPGEILETQVVTKTGDIREVEIKANFMNLQGRKVLQGIFRDVTDRKRAEEENRDLKERLQRSEKMEALGTLTGGIAHDLNNVLGVIIGYSELVLQSVDQSSPLRHRLENVMNGGIKAAAIVDDLLTLARRGVQGRSIVNLNQIVADSKKSPELENLLFYHPSVKIITDLEEGLLNISGSSVHLEKTLYNLISNASEAMPMGGTVAIKTRNQYLDKPLQGYDNIQEGDYVVLSVSDTGEGIANADLRRIFEPFYTKKIMGTSGTGLGLAVVWGTVKDYNGYINVQSELGKGTVFTLYFPVTREEITTVAAAAISEYMGQGETILVVDDVKEQREMATGMLGSLNYNVSSVSSGEEAVAYIKEHEVDLMVLDMIMEPGMDGLDTYKSVLKIRPRQKAIIVSGFSESERVKTAEDIGAGAYVRKPYIKAKLGLAVRKELERTA